MYQQEAVQPTITSATLENKSTIRHSSKNSSNYWNETNELENKRFSGKLCITLSIPSLDQ